MPAVIILPQAPPGGREANSKYNVGGVAVLRCMDGLSFFSCRCRAVEEAAPITKARFGVQASSHARSPKGHFTNR